MDPAEYQKRLQALIDSTGHMHVSGITHPGVSSASSTSIVHEDPRAEEIRLFPSRKITLPKLPAEWNNLPNFTELEVSKDDFADDEWKGIPAIRLVTLSDTSTVDLGIKVLARLGTGVSQKDSGAIFLLAFQLRQEGGGDTRRVFPNDDLRLVNDVDYGDLNEGIIIDTGRNPEPLHRMGDTNDEAKGASFLAASPLRLFTKSPGNFISAWHRIRKGYSDFYGKPLALTGGIVHPEVIVS